MITEVEYLRGNVLIRDFMEEPEIPVRCKYHLSWDWLIQVVEKIESLGKSVLIENYSVLITYSHNQNPREKRLYIFKHEETKIEACWLAVIEFIKWHYENK